MPSICNITVKIKYNWVIVELIWFLFTSLCFIKDPPFEAQDTLRAWQEKNHPWLELSDVHKETTENIRVTVIPFYMGYRENQNTNVYWVSDLWHYQSIKIFKKWI